MSDYAKSPKLVAFVGFLYWVIQNCKSALSEKMDNIGLRANICYLCLKVSLKEVHEDVKATQRAGAPSYSTVKKWDAEIKCDEER